MVLPDLCVEVVSSRLYRFKAGSSAFSDHWPEQITEFVTANPGLRVTAVCPALEDGDGAHEMFVFTEPRDQATGV